MVHGQNQRGVQWSVPQLPLQPAQLSSVDMAALGNAGIEPDHRQPLMAQRPVDVGLMLGRAFRPGPLHLRRGAELLGEACERARPISRGPVTVVVSGIPRIGAR